MSKKSAHNVSPLHKDKYYVYALFKPEDFNPFYIGKGKNNRINEHFIQSNLKVNSPKTGIIKKYGNLIRREILVYFDEEQPAYNFEEYLIALYGLKSEGGCLVNYAKTRFQYCDAFAKDVCSLGRLKRKRTYNKELIMKALEMFYKGGITSKVVSEELGISRNYLLYVITGKKCKHDFNEFASLHKDSIDFENTHKRIIREGRSRIGATKTGVLDSDIITEFEEVVNGNKTVSDAAKSLGIGQLKLGKIFLGKSRKYLKLDYEKYKSVVKGRYVAGKKVLSEIDGLFKMGYSVKDICNKTKYGRTTVYRAIKKLQASGMSSGTGSADGSSGNASDTNSDNTA